MNKRNIEEEFEILEIEINAWNKKVDHQIHLSNKNLEDANFTLETFYFLLFGSLLALAINLGTNIIHSFLNQYGILYYLGVLWMFILSIVLIIKFVTRKWERIKEKDPLLKGFSKGESDPLGIASKRAYYISKLNELKQQIKSRN